MSSEKYTSDVGTAEYPVVSESFRTHKPLSAAAGSRRVAFISCLYPPEPEPAGVMASQLAHSLRVHGHDVTMLVPFPNRPKGSAFPGYRRAPRHAEVVDGVRVVHCPTWFIGAKRRLWNRVMENLSFGFSGAILGALEPRPDVLLLETWPLAATQMCIWQARLRHIPVLYYVQDLYPEVLESSGILARNGLIARRLRDWDRSLCLASSKVIVISESMRETLVQSRGIPSDRIAVIPNWIDEREFRPLPRNNAWRREMGISPDTFVALFAGSLGIVSGANVLVEAARRLRARPDILLLCVGEGVLKDEMVAQASKYGLENIRFEPFQDRTRVPEMHAASDACLLTMRSGYLNASVPSKLISYMAAARPIVCAASAETDVARIVSTAHAGIVVRAGDPDALALALLRLQAGPIAAQNMGSNARSYFETELSFKRRYEQFLAVIQEVTSGRTR